MCSIPNCPITDCTIPHGRCHCSCDGMVNIPKKTNKKINQYAGVPVLFRPGHQARYYAKIKNDALPPPTNPSGLCGCGCGSKTSIAQATDPMKGYVRGQPMPYLPHHRLKQQAAENNAAFMESVGGDGRKCLCGCGGTPPLAQTTNRKAGRVKGQPLQWMPKHEARFRKDARIVGAREKTVYGYIEVFMPDHPDAKDKMIFEHRLVMEKMIGRRLEEHESVHHKNHVRDDNRPDNLELMTKSDHMRMHMLERHGKGDRWAKEHDRCSDCLRTDLPHAGGGLCRNCYARQLARKIRRKR